MLAYTALASAHRVWIFLGTGSHKVLATTQVYSSRPVWGSTDLGNCFIYLYKKDPVTKSETELKFPNFQVSWAMNRLIFKPRQTWAVEHLLVSNPKDTVILCFESWQWKGYRWSVTGFNSAGNISIACPLYRVSLLVCSLSKHFRLILLWTKSCHHIPLLLWVGVSTFTGKIKSFENKLWK